MLLLENQDSRIGVPAGKDGYAKVTIQAMGGIILQDQ